MTAYLGIPTGSNVHWVWNGSAWTLQPYGGGSGGGETAASYVVLSLTSSLSNERRLIAGSGVTITDNGPNNTVVISATGGSSGSSARTFNFDLLRGTEVSSQGSGSMQSIGMSYYDQNLLSGTINSVIFRGILAPSTASTVAYLDLYDYNGIVTGIPNPISGAVMTGSSTTFTLLSANLTSIFSSLTGSGLLDARIWCTPTGSNNAAICKGAWLEMKFV